MVQYTVYGLIVICAVAIIIALAKSRKTEIQMNRHNLCNTRILDPSKPQFIRFGEAMYCPTDDILHEGDICPVCGRSISFNLILDMLSAKELKQQKKVPSYMFNFKSRRV